MKGVIIGKNQGTYLVAGDDDKRYQFESWDWSGKSSPKVGDPVHFVCEGDAISSVFPLSNQQSGHSKLLLAVICLCFGTLGIHRFMVGKIGTGILMLILTITLFGVFISWVWVFIDLILIISGNFTDKNGDKIC
ncbi:TM2 domain-containing protein [Bartonella sp. cb54]|uniref:TM2 domain-containing protein n=1 Tax=Bartonella sp. cb54 TaxID=3385560 RepID=UPI0039A49857